MKCIEIVGAHLRGDFSVGSKRRRTFPTPCACNILLLFQSPVAHPCSDDVGQKGLVFFLKSLPQNRSLSDVHAHGSLASANPTSVV